MGAGGDGLVVWTPSQSSVGRHDAVQIGCYCKGGKLGDGFGSDKYIETAGDFVI
jgi:hypothetical protein